MNMRRLHDIAINNKPPESKTASHVMMSFGYERRNPRIVICSSSPRLIFSSSSLFTILVGITPSGFRRGPRFVNMNTFRGNICQLHPSITKLDII
ncbi:hypothetical protein X975_03820, partial [Stegodyphus mimosarum]